MEQFSGQEVWQTLKAVWYVISPHELPGEDHPEQMADITRRLSDAMGLAAPDIQALEYAVLLHDIGLLKVQETILKKPGRLTPEEFLEIQAHPIESERIINMMPHMERAAQWVRWHHEWWDGGGYPDRIHGKKIPLPSRILVVVDAWNAMQSARPYRPAKSKEEAMNELKLMAGIQFDPNIVRAMQNIIK